MALSDPIAVYNAQSNLDANLVQRFLESHGVDAFAVEDYSITGSSVFATQPATHKPQVWVNREDKVRAALLLVEYEQLKPNRDAEHKTNEPRTITVHCEKCGQNSEFAGSLDGSVQDCPHCGSYVDVGHFDWPGDDSEESDNNIDRALQPAHMIADDSQSPAIPYRAPLSRQQLCIELFAVLCVGVFPYLIVAIAQFIGTSNIYRTFVWDQIILVAFSVQVAAPTLYIMSSSSDGLSKFGLVRPRLPADLCVGLALFAVAWVLTPFIVILVPPWLIPVLDGLEPQSPVWFEKPSSIAQYILLFVALAANAFCEELVMRAYLITRLCQLGLPKLGSVAISSALFASYHLYQGVWSVYQVFFFGMVFGFAFLWVRRIWPLVIAHLVYGFIAYLLFQAP